MTRHEAAREIRRISERLRVISEAVGDDYVRPWTIADARDVVEAIRDVEVALNDAKRRIDDEKRAAMRRRAEA